MDDKEKRYRIAEEVEKDSSLKIQVASIIWILLRLVSTTLTIAAAWLMVGLYISDHIVSMACGAAVAVRIEDTIRGIVWTR